MRSKEFYYIFKDKKYLIHVDYKGYRQKYNYYKLRGDTVFVSANSRVSDDQLIKSLNGMLEKLVKKVVDNYFASNGVYILGELVDLSDGFFTLNGKKYLFGNKEMFYTKMKKISKPLLEERVRYYSKIMNVKTNYKVSVKSMKTRYGSNSSRTKTIALNIILIHYSLDIIDSVVIHELAHDFQRNHSKKFYDVVYRYCPNYNLLDRKLRKGIFKW